MYDNLKVRLLGTFFILIFFTTSIFAQSSRKKYVPNNERFNAGLVFGYNASQIDGDYYKGFNKYGLTAGIRGITRLTSNFDFNIEILYSKKGSKIFHNRYSTPGRSREQRFIDLTYVDVPVFFKLMSPVKASSFHIEFGGIYSRLFNAEIQENVENNPSEFVFEAIQDDFRNSEISFLGGIGFTWQNGLSINYRYSFSFINFYRGDAFGSPSYDLIIDQPVTFLRNYYYTLSLSYSLFDNKTRKTSKKSKKSREKARETSSSRTKLPSKA